MIKRNKIFMIVGLLIIVLAIVSVLYSLTPRSTIALALAPEAGFISIDGGSNQPVNNKQNLTVTPGKHTVKFSRDEFDSYSKDITVADKQTVEIVIALTPRTDAAKQLLVTTGADEVMQRFDNEKSAKGEDQLNKSYPILSILPIQARLYMVTPCQSVKYPNDRTKLALCVDMAESGLEPFVNKDITSKGYDPADYEMVFKTVPNSDN